MKKNPGRKQRRKDSVGTKYVPGTLGISSVSETIEQDYGAILSRRDRKSVGEDSRHPVPTDMELLIMTKAERDYIERGETQMAANSDSVIATICDADYPLNPARDAFTLENMVHLYEHYGTDNKIATGQTVAE